MPDEYSSLFAFASNNTKPSPKFEVGDEVYYVMVDHAFLCTVVDVFEMKSNDGAFKRWGYNLRYIDYDKVVRIWQDCDVDNIFMYFMDAKQKCNENFNKVEILFFERSEIIKYKMFKEHKDHSYRMGEGTDEYGYVVLLKGGIVIYKETQTYSFCKKFDDTESAEIFYEHILHCQYERMKEVNCCEYRNQDDFSEIDDLRLVEERFYLYDKLNAVYVYSELENFYHNRFKRKS